MKEKIFVIIEDKKVYAEQLAEMQNIKIQTARRRISQFNKGLLPFETLTHYGTKKAPGGNYTTSSKPTDEWKQLNKRKETIEEYQTCKWERKNIKPKTPVNRKFRRHDNYEGTPHCYEGQFRISL